MAAPEHGGGLSMTPTQRVGFKHTSRKSDELTSLGRQQLKERSLSGSNSQSATKSLLSAPPTAAPGSFSADLRSALHTRSTTPLGDVPAYSTKRTSKDEDGRFATEQRQAIMRDAIAKEMKIKTGTENMLDALLSKNSRQTREQRLKVEQELGTSNRKLAELRLELDQEIQRSQTPITPPRRPMSSYFEGSPLKTQSAAETPSTDFPEAIDEESPTVVLTDTLQALEVEGMQPDYYIERANKLVELFKRNPTLKYDLAWSVFSLRVQVMLLSESTEVVAAGYRLTRHAITDRASLQTIRSLHTDELVTLSLVKKGSKALLEREQAIKFVRSFLDVKGGVQEISLSVLRSLVAVAEHKEDRLNSICILTLAEILAKNPQLLVSANGINTLTDALAEGTFPAPEAIVASFLHILDNPRCRRFLSSGRELNAVFAPFTDPLMLNGDEEKLRTCAKAIAAILKTWPGFLTLSADNAQSLRSLIDSLVLPEPFARDLILELLFDVLRIKTPSWSSQFLAGRRLTQYGRLAGSNEVKPERTVAADPDTRFDLTAQFTTFILAMLLRCGLVPSLIHLLQAEEDDTLKRKATLLLTEVLKLAYRNLPDSFSAHLQVLGDLMLPGKNRDLELKLTNTNMIYQIDSINRAVNRNLGGRAERGFHVGDFEVGTVQGLDKNKFSAVMDGDSFRQAVVDSQVLSHHNFSKWRWDIINDLIAGPLTNPKRVDELLKSTKFLKRLTGFYRPFKYRFSGLRRIGPNQRYVRTGCALIRTLTQTPVGLQFLKESKLLRQLAECLAQLDPMSGLTSSNPLFDRYQMEETLSGGYFALLGALSESLDGIHIMERWHMMNMFYHIVERDDREDLIRAFLANMDFTLDTHLRVLLSKCLTAASKNIRVFATKLLRKYAVGRVHYSAGLQDPTSSHWALRLVLTQLYDPDVEVCEMAVKILEEACEQRSHLEYVVKCRPSLDHLGEIGAPLLLRFLSTSTGYRYLDGLDYITQEMDDWFLGRNDAYVALVEATLARAYLDQGHPKTSYGEESVDLDDSGLLPPHFYRELARTEEGCRLLRQSGHFYEFSATIRDYRLDEEDEEVLIRIKSCLWAVGNIGSMPLGAPFLEENDVVSSITRVAEGADVMSVRGTACFALGLLSRSLHGSQMLVDCGWEVTVSPSGRLTGLCVPRDISRLCLKRFGTGGTIRHLDKEELARFHSAAHDIDPVKARILKSIIDMGNSVMYKKAAGELHVLKVKHSEAFMDIALFRKTLCILESHHYRLQARQFVLDLFDRSVMRRIVFESDAEDDTDPDSS